MRTPFLVSGLILLAARAAPQAAAPAAGPSPKEARARHVVGAVPQVDGRLDEPAWREAAWFSDFMSNRTV